jgi:hypothetical protein
MIFSPWTLFIIVLLMQENQHEWRRGDLMCFEACWEIVDGRAGQSIGAMAIELLRNYVE